MGDTSPGNHPRVAASKQAGCSRRATRKHQWRRMMAAAVIVTIAKLATDPQLLIGEAIQDAFQIVETICNGLPENSKLPSSQRTIRRFRFKPRLPRRTPYANLVSRRTNKFRTTTTQQRQRTGTHRANLGGHHIIRHKAQAQWNSDWTTSDNADKGLNGDITWIGQGESKSAHTTPKSNVLHQRRTEDTME